MSYAALRILLSDFDVSARAYDTLRALSCNS
jgi:hypothetical protein